MEVESLIPFGLDTESEQLVDVGNVKQGNACGCICPSCKTPLVARHGEEKAWHFAHRSQNVHNETRKQCEYSFAVSVRLMIRQLSNNGLKFRTPQFESSVQAFSEYFHESYEYGYVVTKESLLELKDVQVGTPFCGVTVDVLGNVNGVPFVVFVTYRERSIPSELKHPSITKCGVVELNVDALPRLFKQEDNGQYQEVLRRYIEDKADGKAWIYHPREQRQKDVAIEKFKLWLAQQEAESIKTNKKTRKYTCRLCNSTWIGASNICEKCKTHLYTTELD